MKILDKESDCYVLDQRNLINQGIRVIAVLSLLVASASVLSTEKAYCLFAYYGKDSIVNLDALTGGISKDPSLFGTCGFIALSLFFPLLWSYHRGWYTFFVMILLILQGISLSMIESPSIGQLMYDSIVYCQNYGLLAWVIGQCIFMILSLMFIFHEFRT